MYLRERNSISARRTTVNDWLYCANTPGVGYLDDERQRGIPAVKEGISEELEYAAKHCIEHICEIDNPEPPLVDLLRRFLSTRLVSWMRLVTAIDSFCSLGELKRWMEVS